MDTKANSPDPKALDLLSECRNQQKHLPRSVALAWERATFAEALAHPEPKRRIQTFLGERRLGA